MDYYICACAADCPENQCFHRKPHIKGCECNSICTSCDISGCIKIGGE